MDHLRILKRAFAITTTYRALWIFGIILAVTMGGRGGGSGGNGRGDGTPGFPTMSPELVNSLLIAGAVALCVALLVVIIVIIARNVSETALIRMVDQHERTGQKLTVRQGFRLGWTRAALRLFLLDLVIGLAALITFLLLLLVAASPLLVWLTDSVPARVLGTVVAVALIIVLVFFAIVVSITLSLLKNLWHRAIVLEERNVNDAVRRGWQLLRQRLGDVVVMGLILFALGLAFAFVLIPVVFLLFAVAAIVGGLPALLVYGLTSLVAQGYTPGIAAAIIGVPIFIVVIAVPLAVLGGLAETFQSSTWTRTYRELLALEAGQPLPSGDLPPAVPPPAPDAPAAG